MTPFYLRRRVGARRSDLAVWRCRGSSEACGTVSVMDEILMLTGVSGFCPDCGDKRILVAADEDGFSTPVLEERHFSALKTHDPALVQRLASAAESLIDDALKA